MPSAPTVTLSPLPYERLLEERPRGDIDLAVIHCTELPDLQTARRFGEEVRYDSGTGNSGHYYIDRDGSVHRYVGVERIAHHVRGYNPRSVGIELVNIGRYPDWLAADKQSMQEAYTEAQIVALLGLLESLQRELPALRFIAGHEDLDTTEVAASDDEGVLVHRKLDPGPLFPWDRVMQSTSLQRLTP
ncbi:N-acetylmuramoyl-L-alanine amidase [Pseudoxanthomonas yeongjuensis]|jgi:N-acetylmuramoyl-L-alanine amidase|uniref:N-acetylmuramoyl-L-alanine amidase n=1 Tax=Pseudoxanthomonas yeongjuensis TaxID=377616 RepID=UPI0013917859|nr:N-acetylmuramoyl-L-alanine amidase [Pseudoxanthomonas yeongjuensis]KAF1717427.1 N-acetylmuramoyl-L-alanine amidase [Pseudoxanthomonas yeongjuensis]